MLQTNLIFGIQQKIKDGHQRSDDLKITEARDEILLENYYNPGIVSGIYQQTQAAKKKATHKKSLVTEAFHIKKAEKKLQKDISYFNYLYENFVDDVFKDDFQMLLENVFEDTIRLYQECDVTPRLISPALDSNELNENQIVDLYRNSLNETVKNKYTKPLLSGKISELYENEIRTLTKKLLQEGVSADVEQVRIYLPFEETVYQFNREVILPKTAEARVVAFMESASAEYTDLLEETAADILKTIEQKIKLLTSMVGPNMFDKAVDVDGVNAPKMAGISITVDKNFNDEECIDGPCEMDAAEDPEAAEELADEAEANEIDADGEDIVGAEVSAKDALGQASSSEDLEGANADSIAELSPSEASGEEPGAIEKDLPLQNGSADETGTVTNSSDVELQGQGYDNGVDAGASDATLPGGVPNVGESVNDDDVALSKSPGSNPTSVASDTAGSVNDSDTDLSKGVGTAGVQSTKVSTSVSSDTTNSSDVSVSSGSGTTTTSSNTDGVEIIGADGDDSNAGLGGVQVDAEDDEVNTSTPSEDEMDSLNKEEIVDSVTPRL